MKPLMYLYLCLMWMAFLATSCLKSGDGLPDAMDCKITGKLTIWESDKPFVFDPAHPPTVMLMEQRYYTPWSPYRVPLLKQVVNSKGSYEFNYRLEKEKEYFLEMVGYDPSKYLDFALSSKVQYLKIQQLDVPVVAKAWVIPRFVNQTNQPGDSFLYSYGIGGGAWLNPVAGKIDSIMPWVFNTWGGSKIGSTEHYIKAHLFRNGIQRDTKIYYFAPPGDTSVITIRY